MSRPHQHIAVEFALSPDELRDAVAQTIGLTPSICEQLSFQNRRQKIARKWRVIWTLVLGVGLFFLLRRAFDPLAADTAPVAFVTGIVCVAFLYALFSLLGMMFLQRVDDARGALVTNFMYSRQAQVALVPRCIRISPDGIHESTRFGETFVGWTSVVEIYALKVTHARDAVEAKCARFRFARLQTISRRGHRIGIGKGDVVTIRLRCAGQNPARSSRAKISHAPPASTTCGVASAVPVPSAAWNSR